VLYVITTKVYNYILIF